MIYCENIVNVDIMIIFVKLKFLCFSKQGVQHFYQDDQNWLVQYIIIFFIYIHTHAHAHFFASQGGLVTTLTYTWSRPDKASMQLYKEFQFCGQLKHHSSKQLAYNVGHVMCTLHVYDRCNFFYVVIQWFGGIFSKQVCI